MDWAKILVDWAPVIATGILIPLVRIGVKQGLVSREDFDRYREQHDDEHDKLDDRLQAGEVRFAGLESVLRSLPTQADIQQMTAQMMAQLSKAEVSIAELRGETRQMDAVMKTVQRDVHLLVENHMDGAR